MSKALVIAPWGLPLNWRKANYIVPKIESLSARPLDISYDEGDSIESFTSLSAVLAMLKDAGMQCDVLIVGLDTLAFSTVPNRDEIKDLIDAVEKKIGEIYPDKIIEEIRKSEVNDHTHIYGKVREVAKFILEKSAEKYLHDLDVKPLFAIVPGMGTFNATINNTKVTATLENSIKNLEFRILYELYAVVRGNNYDAVVLDITHGINYLPVITFRTAKLVTEYLHVRDNKDMYFLVLNADPVSGDGQLSRINIVTWSKVSMDVDEFLREVLDEASSERSDRVYTMVKRDEKPDENLNKLNKEYEDIRLIDEIGEIEVSLRYGFPLYLITRMVELRQKFEQLQSSKLLDKLRDYQDVHVENHVENRPIKDKPGVTIKIIRNYALNKTPILMNMAADVIRSRLIKDILSNPMNDGVDINDLDKVPINDVAKHLVSHEIDDIRDRVNALNKIMCMDRNEGYEECIRKLWREFIPYKKVYELTNMPIIEVWRSIKHGNEPISPGNNSNNCGNIDIRNFIAHAGLEMNAISVKHDSNTIYVKYECLDEINKTVVKKLLSRELR